MEGSKLFWILIPLLGIIALAVLRPIGKVNRKSAVKGLIIAATIYGIYYLWRMTQGGP